MMASTSYAGLSRQVIYDENAILELLDESDIEGLTDDEDDCTFLSSYNAPTDKLTHDEEVQTAQLNDDDRSPSPTESEIPLAKRLEGRQFWKKSKWSQPQVPVNDLEDNYQMPDLLQPSQYFTKYFPDSFFESTAEFTNQYHCQTKGTVMHTSANEIKQFFGIHLIMGAIHYPRIRMYWDRKYRLPIIADTMTRDRLFALRVHLHFVDNNKVTVEQQQQNRLWKVQPIIDTVRKACRDLPRSSNSYSIDEQMIPFTGICSLKQYVKNKPRPVGLKNYVCTTSSGLVVDFEVYQGKTTPWKDSGLGAGPTVILHLTQTLPEHSFLYFDRYFTTISLLDALKSRNMYGTGTVMLNRLPKNVKRKVTADKQMRRGDAEEFCRRDEEVCLVRWKDSRVVNMVSNIHGKNPLHMVKRWDKKNRQYIDVQCPDIVKNYNAKMGGVDICDQQMEYYRAFFKTKKWTLKTAIHFIDIAVVNSWMEYKLSAKLHKIPKKDCLDLLFFRLALGEKLISSSDAKPFDAEQDHNDLPPSKKLCAPLPCDEKRLDTIGHLPTLDASLTTARNCRKKGCHSRTKFRCTKCNIYLCISNKNDCFAEYHTRK